jgi:hypothetical protein
MATAIVTAGVELETERLAVALATTDLAANTDVVVIRGTITRKNKYRDHVSLALRKIIESPNAFAAENGDGQPPELVALV